MIKRLGIVGLLAAIGIGTAACNDGYGYGGASLGYSSAGYYDDPYYDGYGYGGGYAGYGGLGLASSYYGWNNGFYYPGTGVYVYDRNRRPYRWNGAQQRYWQGRTLNRQDRREVRQNWQGFRQDRRQDTQAFRQDRRVDRQAYRSGQVTRDQFRTERRADRRSFRQERRQDTRQLNRANRRAVRNAR